MSAVIPAPPSPEDWVVVVGVYRDFLNTYIKASQILPLMCGCIKPAVEERIRSADREERHVDAMNVLLDHLLCADNEKTDADCMAQWSLFDQALAEKYPRIHEIVHGNYSKEQLELQKQLVHFFLEDITETFNPGALKPQLVQSGLFKPAELETIFARCRHEGPTMATMFMVSHIHYNDPNWYRKFLDILMVEHRELVKHIDPDGYEKWMLKEQARMSDTQDTPMEVCSGPADTPKPSLYAAPGGVTSVAGTSRECSADNLETTAHDGGSHARDTGTGCDVHEPQQKKRKLNDEEHSDLPAMTKRRAENGDNAVNFATTCTNNCSVNTEANLKDKDFGSKNIFPDGDNSNADTATQAKEEEEEKDGVAEPIKLRKYQQELAEQALAGKNVIICAPTGSGKTQVALKIIKEHLQQEGRGVRKVVFLVNQVTLAAQQHSECEKYLKPFRCKLVSGDMAGSSKVPLSMLMLGSDVLVMTAQILLDALDEKEVKDICQFSMLVFDECHHTSGKHPFNCIMHHYMANKFSPENEEEEEDPQVPQVVGLTASVGVGKAGDQEAARNHIRKLCAHLDAENICTVIENVAELAQYSNEPRYEQYMCDGRPEDRFKRKIEEIMRTIEEQMDKSEYTLRIDGKTGIRAKLHPPSARGTAQYTSWASQLRDDVAKLDDAEARRFLESSRRMLLFYNNALGINDDFDTEDALNYLKNEFKQVYDAIGDSASAIDISLKELFEKNTPYLEVISRQQANTNGKLIRLEEILLKKFEEDQESRAMVFVKTRDMATALVAWMLRRPELKDLKPGKMTGAGTSAEQGGMTKSQQLDVMKYFKEGNHRILVATSVAEEGLDIQKCNLVIRYSYVTNEIAMVQARGRARAEDSQFVTLAGKDRSVQQKDEINLIREMMTRSAIHELQQDMKEKPERCRQSRVEIQREEKTKRDYDRNHKKGREKKEGEFELRCRKCDAYACLSSHIRTIKTKHHVVIHPDFRERFNEKPHPKPVFYDSMQMKYKLFCKSCGEHWGNANLYEEAKFPVLKIDAFIVTDDYGRRDAPKKWKDAKFKVQELNPAEQEQYYRDAMNAGYVAE